MKNGYKRRDAKKKLKIRYKKLKIRYKKLWQKFHIFEKLLTQKLGKISSLLHEKWI